MFGHKTMCTCNRRSFAILAGCGFVTFLATSLKAGAQTDRNKFFLSEAFRMKAQAIASRDQPYGAVIVRANEIVGYGPSRVVIDRNVDAHAERVALWDAQRRLKTENLTGAIIYSTSRPCSVCQDALATANFERMYFGKDAIDGGKPRFN